MSASIESLFGSSIQIEHRPFTNVRKRESKRRPNEIEQVANEFDKAIHAVNSTPADGIDTRLGPHLKNIANAISVTHKLPTLAELRVDQHQKTRQAVDAVFIKMQDTVTIPDSRWGWIEELHRPRIATSAIIIEAYKDILTKHPAYTSLIEKLPNDQGKPDPKTIVLAIEEAMVLRQLAGTSLNRDASRWYTAEEGFTNEFVDYSRLQRLLQFVHAATPDLGERTHMDQAFAFAQEEPDRALYHGRTIQRTINTVNAISRSKRIRPELSNMLEIQHIIAENPLTGPLDNTAYPFLVTAMTRVMNKKMKYGEVYTATGEAPLGEHPTSDFLSFHVHAKTPEAVYVGSLIDGLGCIVNVSEQYKGISSDVVVNAFCEVLGASFPNSRTVNILDNPDHGLMWYDPRWGFSDAFIQTLRK